MAARRIPQGAAAAVLAAALALTGACVKQKTVRWKMPAFASVWNLKVGSGAAYEAGCTWGDPSRIEIAIVGEEAVGTQRGYWLEVSSAHPGSSKEFVTKALFYEKDKHVTFVRAVAKVPGHPPMELPDAWMFGWTRGLLALAAGYIEPYQGEVRPTSRGVFVLGPGYPPGYFSKLTDLPSELAKAKRLGLQKLATRAGSFAAQHWRFKAASEPWRPDGRPVDIWLAGKAGPFGLVKARLRDSSDMKADMVLTRIVSDATDKIAATPERADADKLWQWSLQGRDTPSFLCLPQVGLPGYGPSDPH